MTTKKEWTWVDADGDLLWLDDEYVRVDGKLVLRGSVFPGPRIGRDVARQIGEALIEFAREEQRGNELSPEDEAIGLSGYSKGLPG